MSVLLQDRVAISDEQVRVLENRATTSLAPSSPLWLVDKIWLTSIPVCIIALLMGVSIALGWASDIPSGSVPMYGCLVVGVVALLVFWGLLPFVGKSTRVHVARRPFVE